MTNSSSSLPPITAPPPSTTTVSLSSFGLGYSIAIALGFLVLLSTLILSSYLCCRHHRHNHNHNNRREAGIILPRLFFVSEEDDEENPNPNGVVGLHQSAINSYPKYSFSTKSAAAAKDDLNSSICSICLSDYSDGEMLRMMPECKHFFHLLCLDAWLRLNGSCPVCRSSPLPTPISTPLAEVVPLTQYASDRRRRS